jgi:hypothetical protein
MFYLDSVPIKLTVHDPVLNKDRIVILYLRNDHTGYGITCDDGTYVVVEDQPIPLMDCYDLRNSFIRRSYLCFSRKVHRPIWADCKAFSKKS